MGDANAWGRTDWGELNPLDDDNWKHIWPLVGGHLEEKIEWLTSALWQPELVCPVTRGELKRPRLAYEIVTEILDVTFRNRIQHEIEEAVFPLLIEGGDYFTFETSECEPSKAMTRKLEYEDYGVEFDKDFDGIDAWGTVVRHLEDSSERLEVRMTCVKIAGVESGGYRCWKVSHPNPLQMILADPREPPELRLLCYRYLATGQEIDYKNAPDIWEINFQVYSDWLQPALLSREDELASQSVEAVRRRILATKADTKLGLARDFLASKSVSLSAKCEVVDLLIGVITDYTLIHFCMYEPELLFTFDLQFWGSDLRSRHLADMEYQQWVDDHATPPWPIGPEEYAARNSDYRDEPLQLTPPPFLGEGEESAILLRVLNDCGEHVRLRRLCALHLGVAYRRNFDSGGHGLSGWGEEDFASDRKMIDRSQAVERLIERIALDRNESWMLRCTCTRLLFFHFQTIWEEAAERAAKFLATVVMDDVDEENTNARIFQEFAVETFIQSEKEMEDWSPDDRELHSLTDVAEAEFGERFLHALWNLDAKDFDLKPFLAEQFAWPQLADDAEATEELAWREYVLKSCNHDNHSEIDLVRFAETLGKVDEPKCKDWLRTRLNDKTVSIKIRQACASALYERGGEEDLNLLLEKFEDEETVDELRGHCAWFLWFSDKFNCVHHKILEYIVDEKESESLRLGCLEAVSSSDYKEVKSVCIPLLENATTPESLVEQASTALAAFGDSEDLPYQLKVIDNDSASEKLRCSIISNLDPYDDRLRPLLDRVNSNDIPERLKAACVEGLNRCLEAVSSSDYEDVRTVCIPILTNAATPESLINQASVALAVFEEAEDLPFQLKIIDNQSASEKLRCSIISTIIIYDEAWQPLLERLKNNELSKRLRAECVVALNIWIKFDKSRDQFWGQIKSASKEFIMDPNTPLELHFECRRRISGDVLD